MTPEVWTEQLELMSYHCDRTDHLSLWGMCRIFQEASAHHTDGSVIGYEELLPVGKGWVLIRMHYEMYRMPSIRDIVTVNTWSRGTDGLIAVRDFQMLDTDGNVLCSASTHWVIIDMIARRVVRAKELMQDFPSHDELSTSLATFGKLRPGSFGEETRIADIPANDSFIDHTQHVNNAEYIKLMSDHFPFATNENDDYEAKKHGTSRFDGMMFQIDYPAETKPGETLSVFRKQEGDSIQFQICNSRGVSAVARFAKLYQCFRCEE